MRKIAVLAGTILMTGGLMLAQQPATGAGSNTKSDAAQSSAAAGKMSDDAFARKAAEGGLAEVELGQLAAQKASNADVKAFAQKMVDDHTKVNDQLKQVAAQQNIQLPAQLSAKDKAEKARLEKLSGQAFDRAYMKNQVMDHKKDIAAFQQEATNGRDEAIKSFAQQTLPTLHEHLKLAENADSQVKSASNNNGNATSAAAH